VYEVFGQKHNKNVIFLNRIRDNNELSGTAASCCEGCPRVLEICCSGANYRQTISKTSKLNSFRIDLSFEYNVGLSVIKARKVAASKVLGNWWRATVTGNQVH
jgi:hypothetical protein